MVALLIQLHANKFLCIYIVVYIYAGLNVEIYLIALWKDIHTMKHICLPIPIKDQLKRLNIQQINSFTRRLR